MEREGGVVPAPESVVRELLALWGRPDPAALVRLFADDAVWVDGPNGEHHGAQAVVDELVRQLSIFPGQWIAVDTLVADGPTVMVEWHGGFPARGTMIETKVMAVFEVGANGRIQQMRESFDMGSLVRQLEAAGVALG